MELKAGVESETMEKKKLVLIADDFKDTREMYRHFLSENGLDVALAKISTEANRAIDVFYVTDTAGRKLIDAGATGTVRQALLDALR